MTARIDVSPEQRANLERLAAYLEERCDPSQFSMTYFHFLRGPNLRGGHAPRGRSPGPDDVDYSDCGTVCCAVGHGPAAGIAPRGDEGWNVYMAHFFTDGHRELYWSLFAGEWRHVDNTPRGAAERIRRFLSTGELRHYTGSLIQRPLDAEHTPS